MNTGAQVVSGYRDSLVFPPIDELLAPKSLRNVAACALLRLPDQRVRFLRAPNAVWTEDRLDTAGRLLMQLDHDGASADTLAKRLAYALGIPGLALPVPGLEPIDVTAWGVRATAIAMVARKVRAGDVTGAPARAAEEVCRVEAELCESLAANLEAFKSRMDPDARTAATCDVGLDLTRYNVLVREPRRQWRLQFARTFAVLVDAVATAAPGSFGYQILESVDAGTPLVRSLAARFGISPAALRSLVGRPVALIGAHWEARPLTLLRVLDALCPEDRPGDDPESWGQLSRAVAAAEDLFRRPAASSPLTLGWIRRAARHGYRGVPVPEQQDRFVIDALPAIDQLRAALVRHLVDRSRTEAGMNDSGADSRASAIADHRLAHLHPRRLAGIARRFALEFTGRREAIERVPSTPDDTTYWPLIPRDYHASDGGLRVVALVSRADIRSEGVRQDLCIKGGAELKSMLRACASGNAFLLSVRDAVTGRSLSTAEIHAARRRGVGEVTFRVVQHKGQGNARPPTSCTTALSKVLSWAAGAEGQEHLAEGRRQAWKRRLDRPESEAEADRVATAQALPIALGEVLYESLVRAMAGDQRGSTR